MAALSYSLRLGASCTSQQQARESCRSPAWSGLQRRIRNRQEERFVMVASLITDLISTTGRKKWLVIALLKTCRRKRKMVAPDSSSSIFFCCFCFPPPLLTTVFASHACIILIILHPPSLIPELHKIWSCPDISLFRPSPGILFVRLGLLPAVIMLPFHIQLHHQPAGLLLPAAAGHAGVHHHDSARHGGKS